MFLSLLPIFLGIVLLGVAFVFVYRGMNEYLIQNSRLSRRLQPGLRGPKAGEREAPLVPDEGLFESVEKYLTPNDPERRSKIQKMLLLAGYRNPATVRKYFAWKWGIAIAGVVASSFLLAATMTRVNPILPAAATVVIVVVCYFATDMWIMRKTAYRRIAIERAFPDALDLLLVCVEAGHGLDQAINRVAREMKNSAPTLAEELSLVVAELRAGKERDRVLRDFAERTKIDDISAFVTVIKQADQFGVSIADTLRVYSREMRNKRYMRAEEKANMMPIQLALGAIAFTIPPVILILIGPSVILILREMAKATVVG